MLNWNCQKLLGLLQSPFWILNLRDPINLSKIVPSGEHQFLANSPNFCYYSSTVIERDQKEIPRVIRTIGVLAGLAAPQATLEFEKAVHDLSLDLIPRRLTTGYPPMVVIHFREVPFKMENNEFIFPVEPNPNLLETAKQLGKLCDFWVMVANAPHIFRESLEKSSGKEFLSMIDVTVEEVKRRRLRKVGIIAIGLSLKAGLFQKPLSEAGIRWEAIPGSLADDIDTSVFKVMEGEDPRNLGQPAAEAALYLRASGC